MSSLLNPRNSDLTMRITLPHLNSQSPIKPKQSTDAALTHHPSLSMTHSRNPSMQPWKDASTTAFADGESTLKEKSTKERKSKLPNGVLAGLYDMPLKECSMQRIVSYRGSKSILPSEVQEKSYRVRKSTTLLLEPTNKSLKEKALAIKSMVLEEISKLPETDPIKSLSLLKLRLLVAGSPKELLYIERTVSPRSLISSFILYHFSPSRFACSYTAQSNKALVDRTLRFLRGCHASLCIYKCRFHPKKYSKYSGLLQYIREQPDECDEGIYILDNSEMVIVDQVFFGQSAVEDGSKAGVAVQDDEMLENMEEPVKGVRHVRIMEVESQATFDNLPSYANKYRNRVADVVPPRPASPEQFKKSRWFHMIEASLQSRDILNYNLSDFAPIFNDYHRKNKKSQINDGPPTEEELERQRVKKEIFKPVEKMCKLKELVSLDIWQDRSQRINSRIAYDDEFRAKQLSDY